MDSLSSNIHEGNSDNNLLSHSFIPFINLPTRGTACIDHIWSNKMLELNSGIFHIDSTDHMPLFITFPVAFLTQVNILSSRLETTAKNVWIDSKDPSVIMLMPLL